MLIAQISDPHILAAGALYQAVVERLPNGERRYAPFDTARCLSRSIAEINGLDPRPDIAVVTGDLCDHGAAAEYDNLARLLAAFAMPVFVIPGNHDSRTEMRRSFRGDGYFPSGDFLQYTIDDYPLRLVALDTLVPGEHRGQLCADRLAWLDRTLAAQPNRPTVVMMHHPPFATGITYMDNYGLEGAGALGEILARHPQVERVLCGHLHRAIDRRFGGTVAGTAPSTAHQIRLNLISGAPLRFIAEPAGYQLHSWQDGGLVTHTAVLGDWPVPTEP